jgi:hypothetical protein
MESLVFLRAFLARFMLFVWPIACVSQTTVWWRSAVNEGEERLAFLEGRVEEQAMRIDDVRDALVSLEQRLDRRLESFEQRMDQRFAMIDQRFIGIDQRFIGIEQRFAGIDQRLDSIDARFGRIYALLIAMLVAIVGGMGGIIAAILQR